MVHPGLPLESTLVGAYLPVTKGRARILMHGLVKLRQFCMSLVALWSQNGSFKHSRAVIF